MCCYLQTVRTIFANVSSLFISENIELYHDQSTVFHEFFNIPTPDHMFHEYNMNHVSYEISKLRYDYISKLRFIRYLERVRGHLKHQLPIALIFTTFLRNEDSFSEGRLKIFV